MVGLSRFIKMDKNSIIVKQNDIYGYTEKQINVFINSLNFHLQKNDRHFLFSLQIKYLAVCSMLINKTNCVASRSSFAPLGQNDVTKSATNNRIPV